MSGTDPRDLVDRVLADPQARHQLAQALALEIQREPATSSFWRKARPFLAGVSSAAVVLLAFLVPAVQDQWDRHQLRDSIDRYAQIAARLMREQHYQAAEQAYARALELAGGQRVDLLEAQIRARVMRVYDNPRWRGTASQEVTEADFIYLLDTEDASGAPAQRASTLAAYGAWLAGVDRWDEARRRLAEALAVDPHCVAAHVHLGNVYDDLGRGADAEREYRAALAIEPGEASAHYNIGLLYTDQGRAADAERELRAAQSAAPDADVAIALVAALGAQQRRGAALAEARRGLQQFPRSAELKALVAHLQADPSGS